MKNSVWHYKFWKKKLNELPVDVDLNTAWSEMQSILDKDLPINDLPKDGGLTKTIGSKIVSMLGYILPVAAMIAGITYFGIKQPKPEKLSNTKHVNKNLLLKVPDTLINTDTLKSDSISFINEDYMLSNAANIDSIQNQFLVNSIENLEKPATADSIKAIETSMSIGSDKNRNENRVLADQQTEDQEKVKTTEVKSVKNRKPKHQIEIHTPVYNYGFEAGLNISSSGQNIFIGATATYAINKRLLINTGLRLSFANALEGSYRHPNYNLKDSASKENLTIIDQRKLTTVEIPLGLEYKISNRISIKAGPVVSFVLNQGGIGSKLSSVKNPLDTVYNSKKINNALSNSTINKLNIGFAGGLNIRIQQFNIEAGYRQNITPYKVSSDLGSYKKDFKTFQIGIGYSFK